MLGNLYLALDDYELARQSYLESLEVSKDNSDDWDTGVIYFNLGKVELELKNYSESEKHFKKSLAIATKSKNIILEGFSYFGLADIAKINKSFAIALSYQEHSQVVDSGWIRGPSPIHEA